MITIILSEIQSWRLKFSKYSFIVIIPLLSVISILSLLNPVICIQLITVLLIWLGWLSGKQSWSGIKYDDWIKQPNMSTKNIVIGKTLSLIIIITLHIFFISPILFLIIIMRGIPFQLFIWALLSMIISSIISLCFTFLFNWVEIYDFEYFGTFLLIFWLISTLFIPSINFLNPLIQIKLIFETEKVLQILFALSINFILIIILSSFNIFFLYLKKRG